MTVVIAEHNHICASCHLSIVVGEDCVETDLDRPFDVPVEVWFAQGGWPTIARYHPTCTERPMA